MQVRLRLSMPCSMVSTIKLHSCPHYFATAPFNIIYYFPDIVKPAAEIHGSRQSPKLILSLEISIMLLNS